jgi:hypothetical protein
MLLLLHLVLPADPEKQPVVHKIVTNSQQQGKCAHRTENRLLLNVLKHFN